MTRSILHRQSVDSRAHPASQDRAGHASHGASISVESPPSGDHPIALVSLPADDRKVVIDWLRDCEKDARYSEPEVGIFANPNVADAFAALATIVESDTAPTEPVGAVSVTRADTPA